MTLWGKITDLLKQDISAMSPSQIADELKTDRVEVSVALIRLMQSGAPIRRMENGTYRHLTVAELSAIVLTDKKVVAPSRRSPVRGRRFSRVENSEEKLKLLTRISKASAPELRELLVSIREDIKRLDRYARGLNK